MVSSGNTVQMLPKDFGSLAQGLPPAEPGTLFVLGTGGGMRVPPDAGFDVVFGRNESEVHICVGPNDPHVSRRHGYLTRQYSRWLLVNLGRLPIRFPGSQLVLSGDRSELAPGYSPLFIVGPKHMHLLEVRIATATPPPDPHGSHEAETRSRTVWPLSPVERLVLTCLSQRYLRHEPQPQPLTWAQVAAELSEVRPAEKWTWRRAAHIVTNVRKRLATSVSGLLEEEVPPPVGNALNHNLIVELLVTTTLTTSDLHALDDG
jgi:hypothetical protein